MIRVNDKSQLERSSECECCENVTWDVLTMGCDKKSTLTLDPGDLSLGPERINALLSATPYFSWYALGGK